MRFSFCSLLGIGSIVFVSESLAANPTNAILNDLHGAAFNTPPVPNRLTFPDPATHSGRAATILDTAFIPALTVLLHYAEPGWENAASFHGGTVNWTLHEPALVVNDHSTYIDTIVCGIDGSTLNFMTDDAYEQALEWSLPMYFITEGVAGLCAYADNEYHPILARDINYVNAAKRSITYNSHRASWKSSAAAHHIILGSQSVDTSASVIVVDPTLTATPESMLSSDNGHDTAEIDIPTQKRLVRRGWFSSVGNFFTQTIPCKCNSLYCLTRGQTSAHSFD